MGEGSSRRLHLPPRNHKFPHRSFILLKVETILRGDSFSPRGAVFKLMTSTSPVLSVPSSNKIVPRSSGHSRLVSTNVSVVKDGSESHLCKVVTV